MSDPAGAGKPLPVWLICFDQPAWPFLLGEYFWTNEGAGSGVFDLVVQVQLAQKSGVGRAMHVTVVR